MSRCRERLPFTNPRIWASEETGFVNTMNSSNFLSSELWESKYFFLTHIFSGTYYDSHAMSISIHTCMLWHVCCGQRITFSFKFSSTMWILRVVLGFLGLEAGNFTYWAILLGHTWAFNTFGIRNFEKPDDYTVFRNNTYTHVLFTDNIGHNFKASSTPVYHTAHSFVYRKYIEFS